MSWASRRRWRAGARLRDRAACAREISRALIDAHGQARERRTHIAWLQSCLADERDRIPPRLFAAATRQLERYLLAKILTITRELQGSR